MLMEMIENQEKSTEHEKEQENGTDEVNGVEQKESDQEADESSEVTVFLDYLLKEIISHFLFLTPTSEHWGLLRVPLSMV